MSQIIISPVTKLLEQNHIACRVIEIPLTEDKKPVRNLEEYLSSQGLDPRSVVRSVLFKTGTDKFVMLAVAGGGRADWAGLRQHLGEKKCRMAEFDEVLQATGYVIGAVPPIALPGNIRLLVDNSVKDYEQVVISSGVPGYALTLKGSDLLALFGDAEQGQFVKT